MNSTQIPRIAILLIALIISMPVCFASELSLSYDQNGNLITGDGKYRTYNSFNQLWKIYNGNSTSGYLMEEYTYHPTEERVLTKKIYDSSGMLIETTYYIDNNNVQIKNLSGTFNYTYIYNDGQLLAQSLNDQKTFYHTDIKGNVIATTNSTGQLIEQTTYSPFGEVLSGGTSTRYGYEGKEYSGSSYTPAGHWTLDNNDMTTVGYTFYNGVAVGAVQSSFGKYGNSYYFDGNDDYINISKNALTSSSFTISFWSYSPSENNNTGYIYCDAGATSNLFFRRYDNGLRWNGGIAGINLGSTTNIPLDEWVHTAVVLNGSTAYVYVNGVKMNMTGITTGISFTGLTTSLFLGNRNTLDRDYEGYLDNFRIYSKAMSQSEIQNIYDNEKAHPLTNNGLQASYEFENAINDSNNLVVGRFDGAYTFNGNGSAGSTQQYISIPNSDDLNIIGNKISISMWIKPNLVQNNEQILISKNSYNQYKIGYVSSGKFRFTLKNSTNTITDLNSPSTYTNTSKWYHVVGTYDGSMMKLYVDGQQVTNTSFSGNIKSSTNDVVIGCFSGSLDRCFNGSIDEVSIFDDTLTDEQITSLYTTQYATVAQQLDFHARIYNPQLAIFNQPDSIIQNVYDPQSLNRYSFERNNPINNEDPNGHIPLLLATGSIGGIIGGLIGAGSSVYSQMHNSGHVDMQQVGKSMLTGMAAGFVAGATFGLATPIIGQIANSGGAMRALPIVATAGGISSVAGGQASVISDNILSGQNAFSGIGNAQQMGGDFLLGAGTSGLTYGISTTASGFKTGDGKTLELRPHAAYRMNQKGISRYDVSEALTKGKSFEYTQHGNPQIGYYTSKAFVATDESKIVTVINNPSDNYINNVMNR